MKNKHFLIITSSRSTSTTWAERERYVKDFNDNLAIRLDDVDVHYTTYDDITCLVQDGKVSIVDRRHELDLKDVNIVHFKNWMFDSEQAAMIAFYLQHHGVAYFNSEVNAGLAWGKISQMCRLAIGGVPVPDTFYAKQAILKQIMSSGTIPTGFSFPMIMKADDGSKGNDNYLIKSAAEAIDILNDVEAGKEFVIQNFVPNDGDYRLLFIGIDDTPLVFHRQGEPGSHLNNTSQGGSGTLVDAHDMPAGCVSMARTAAEILRREISGVDVIVNKESGKAYVLEVNSTPALATGYIIDRKNAKFAKFLEQQLEVQEEE